MMPTMATPLESAGREYRDALAQEEEAKAALAKAQAARKSAAERVAKARVPLAEAIVSAARKGKRQKDILAEIGDVYTRETVRRICRAAGVEPQE